MADEKKKPQSAGAAEKLKANQSSLTPIDSPEALTSKRLIKQLEQEANVEWAVMKDSVSNMGERTSVQGLPNLVSPDTRTSFRIIWLIALTAAFAGTLYFVALAIQNYLEYDVKTVVEITRENEFEFPTVTFCNLQICGFKDYDYSSYLKKYKQDEEDKFGTSQDANIEEKLAKDSTKTSFFSAKEVFLRKYEDTELMKILNQRDNESISKMMVSCEFMGEPCSDDDFQSIQMGEFSKCYRFNGRPNQQGAYKKTTRFGQSFGLRMELYVGTQDECKSPLSTASGLIAYVHNHTYTLTEEDNGLLVKPGTETYIALDRTSVKKLPAPYSNCFESLETYPKNDLIVRTVNLTDGNIYSQQYCLQLCYQDFLLQFCDCYDHTLPNFRPVGKNPCPKFIDSLYNCQYLIEKLFYNGKNDEYCLKECPKECEYVKFDTTISNVEYPAPGYHEILSDYNAKNNLINEGVLNPDGMLSLNVFYSSNSNTRIYEKPAVEMNNLIADLGGRLGLFLGVSILSLMEVFELLYEVFYTFARIWVVRLTLKKRKSK